jgi:hypothetical protein
MGLSFEEALAVMKSGGIVRRPCYGRMGILIRKENGRNRICQISFSDLERYRANNNIPLRKYRFQNIDIFANDFEVL